MGDTDGSSSAARSAHLNNGNSEKKSVNMLARVAVLFSFGNKAEQLNTNENTVGLKREASDEVGNLLRLSVEDVSIPKAGDLIALESRSTIHFKPSNELKKRVDNKN